MISLSWIVGVVAEILVFIFFDYFHKYFRLLTIVKFSIVVAILRWLILANCTSPGLIILAQVFHGITFGSFFIATLKLGNLYVPDTYKLEAQGLIAENDLSRFYGFNVVAGANTGQYFFDVSPINVSKKGLYMDQSGNTFKCPDASSVSSHSGCEKM